MSHSARPRYRAPKTVDLVGLAEAAAMLELSKAALCERRGGRSRIARLLPFPQPVAELRCGPVWLRSQIEEYRQALAELDPRDDDEPTGIDPLLEGVLHRAPMLQPEER